MNYLYLITWIILYLVLIFIKKDNKKYNFVISSIFIIGILYCLNIFIVFLLSLIKLKAYLWLLSVINIIFSSLIIFISYKKNKGLKIQKLEFNYKEIIFSMCIILICLVIGVVRFNKFQTINYETTDPAIHYKTSLAFAKNLSLLTEQNSLDEMYGSFKRTMPGFALNCGLFMKTFPFIKSYIAYELFDLIVLCLLGLTFYATCLKVKKIKNNNLIVFIISCLYLGSYVLNNLVFGFGYLGVGVLATNLIILSWLYIEEDNNIILNLLLSLFNFTLFFSYYLFVPTVFLGQGLYYLYKLYKKEKFINILKTGIITLGIPFILGFIYFIIPGFLAPSTTTPSIALSTEGYIYRDLWSNFILIMPLIIFGIINEIKNKNINAIFIIFIVELLYILITFLLGLNGNFSSYYYFKSYYIFWLFNYFYIIKLINVNNKEIKLFYNINILYIASIVIICLLNIESRIQKQNILFNNTIVTPSYANIYWFNASRIAKSTPVLDKGELDLIEHLNLVDEKQEIPLLGNYMQKIWLYSLTDIVPIYQHKKMVLADFYIEEFDYENWLLDNNSLYLIIFNSYMQDKDIDIDYEDYKIIYQNNSGSIIKKKY